MEKFEKASVEERILHSTSKYCKRGIGEATVEGRAELYVTTRSSEATKGDTETHSNEVQTEILRMTNILATPLIFT